MAQAKDIQRLKERLEDHPGQMLSVCLSVNAEKPENQGRAYAIRLKDALKETGAPEELQSRVSGAIEEDQPGARTIIIFAAEDGFFEYRDLQVDLPEAFHYGDPYLTPLVLALDEHEPYGAVVIDAEEYRFFVTAPVTDPAESSTESGSGFFREIDLHPSSPHPRGGTDFEPASRRTEAHVSQFYNELGELTRKVAFQEGARHLILLGPRERTSEFRERLPNEVKDRVLAEEHVANNAPESEILKRLEEVRGQAERRRKGGLLSEARERGVRGISETIEALQEGRVYQVLALWDLDAEVRWSDAEGLAITDITQKESPYSGEDTRVRPVVDVLIDLAAARGARLEFVREETRVAETPNEDQEEAREGEDNLSDTLRREFDGVVGLIRY